MEIQMFKHLWIVALIIAYVVAWINVVKDIIYVNRMFEHGHRFENLKKFNKRWIILHVAVPIVASFCLFFGGE